MSWAHIPFGWIDDGSGTGTTPSGAPWAVFGNRLASPADWTRTVALITQAAADQPGAARTPGGDAVHVVYADDRGFAHRARFADRYRDVRVTSTAAPIPPPERANGR